MAMTSGGRSSTLHDFIGDERIGERVMRIPGQSVSYSLENHYQKDLATSKQAKKHSLLFFE
jgi:predicted DNA-binding ribbon-helix-helix protein